MRVAFPMGSTVGGTERVSRVQISYRRNIVRSGIGDCTFIKDVEAQTFLC